MMTKKNLHDKNTEKNSDTITFDILVKPALPQSGEFQYKIISK